MAGTNGVLVRDGRHGDIDALLAIESRFPSDQLSRRSFRRAIGGPSQALLVAESRNEIAGYALVLFRRNSRVARLYSIAVATAHTGRGLGATLLGAAEDRARARGCDEMRLEVDPANRAATTLYQQAGYVETGRLPAYYENGRPAVRFARRLTVPSEE